LEYLVERSAVGSLAPIVVVMLPEANALVRSCSIWTDSGELVFKWSYRFASKKIPLVMR